MNGLETTLRAARERVRKILVPFLTGFWPDRETFVGLLLAAQAEGADAVEVGLPFSDPSADGPVIQRGAERALKAGTRLRDRLGVRREDRPEDAEEGRVPPAVLILGRLEGVGEGHPGVAGGIEVIR